VLNFRVFSAKLWRHLLTHSSPYLNSWCRLNAQFACPIYTMFEKSCDWAAVLLFYGTMPHYVYHHFKLFLRHDNFISSSSHCADCHIDFSHQRFFYFLQQQRQFVNTQRGVRVRVVQPPPPIESSGFFELRACKIYCPSSAPILIKSYRKTLKIVC